MRFKALSDKGKKRSTNEDNFFINEKLQLFIVADGMGGHAAGEVASQTAVDYAADYEYNLMDPLKTLSELTNGINQKIIAKSLENPEYKSMGTTLAAVLIKENKLYYVNLGDSRIYLYSSKKQSLTKISNDHSLVADLIEKGKITEAEAFDHPKKNMLTQALGLEEELDLDLGEYKISNENYLLLCTDGLTDMIRTEDIEAVFNNNNETEEIAAQLLEDALANGGYDNITLIVAGLDDK